MKKNTVKKTEARSKIKNKIRLPKSEKTIDTVPLSRDIPEEDREFFPDEMEPETSNASYWSEPLDRGEDLANMRDPFVQEPERDTQNPPEINQKRPGKTPNVSDNLADIFDAERQSPPL